MNVSNWIHNNITGAGLDYARATLPTGPDSEEQGIEHDVDQISGQIDEHRKPVDVNLQGGYNTLSQRDKLALGATGGAVVGGALGAARGLLGASAPFSVNANWQSHEIVNSTVSFDQSRIQVPGTTQVATPHGLQDVTVPNAAIRYHFEPKVETAKAGEYRTPGTVESQRAFTTNTLVGAAEGAAVGALGGVALTAGFMVVQHLRGKDTQTKPTENINFGDEKKTIITSGATGAAIGGAVGLIDGLIEKARAGTTQTLEWDTPVMNHQVIGHVPQDAVVMVRQDVRYDQNALSGAQVFNTPSKFNLDDYLKHATQVDVQGDVPERHILGIGGFKMDHHTQDVHAEARYGLGTTVVGGIVVGGLVGVAAGVAVNVIRKVVDA